MRELFTFQLLTEIVFGLGTAAKTGKIARKFKVQKALIVTDPGILQATIVEPIIGSLKEAGMEWDVFSDVVPSPHIGVIEEGTEFCRQGRSELVIGVGGGSSLDTAKGICLMVKNPGRITDYEGADKFEKPPLPLVAIPTTAGTGSEVTKWSVITDIEAKRKFSVGGSLMTAQVAICDPLLTITMPSEVTAATGMDALTHAIEAYTNTNVHPLCDLLATKAIQLVGKHLLVAVANGKNVKARSGMLLASLLAGIAFDNGGLGAVHCLTNPICSRFDVPHGLANAIMLPHVVEYNLLGDLEKFKEIARLLGERLDGLGLREAASRAVVAIKRLLQDSGLSTFLRAVGVKEGSFPKMASAAIKIGAMAVNPRTPTLQDLIALYRQAYEGFV